MKKPAAKTSTPKENQEETEPAALSTPQERIRKGNASPKEKNEKDTPEKTKETPKEKKGAVASKEKKNKDIAQEKKAKSPKEKAKAKAKAKGKAVAEKVYEPNWYKAGNRFGIKVGKREACSVPRLRYVGGHCVHTFQLNGLLPRLAARACPKAS